MTRSDPQGSGSRSRQGASRRGRAAAVRDRVRGAGCPPVRIARSAVSDRSHTVHYCTAPPRGVYVNGTRPDRVRRVPARRGVACPPHLCTYLTLELDGACFFVVRSSTSFACVSCVALFRLSFFRLCSLRL